MFILKIHSVDTNRPLFLSKRSNPNHNLDERRGVLHLYGSTSQTSIPSLTSRSTLLFVIAVPNYMSSDDFIRFCGSHIDNVIELLFIRNDGIEDRYSVLIKLDHLFSADDFYNSFNGKRFSPSEAEVCHILFMNSAEYTELAEIACIPPSGFTELPTCPICLERLDPDTSGILGTICDHSFQCSCPSKWTLSCQVCRVCQQQDENPGCSVCGTLEKLWVCLICGFVGCGRYNTQHAIKHWEDTQHRYSLDLITKQIWDYVGDKYVHRLNQSKSDGKMVSMHPCCISGKEDCGTCGCSEDPGVSGALFNSKVEDIFNEYNHLLASQLETQRQYYESQLMEAKTKKEGLVLEAVETAINYRMNEIQVELEKLTEEKNSVANINEELVKSQEILRQKAKKAEEREASSLRSKDEYILDLGEQIRDLRVYIEAQKTISNMNGTDDLREGTVLPVPLKQSSPATAKKNSKSGRRRRN